MANAHGRATDSALEDLLGPSTEASSDSDGDFAVQAEPVSDSSSISETEQPSQTQPLRPQRPDGDGAPGSSRGIVRTRRPITSELTHQTYLNTPGLSQQQRNHIRRLRDQERARRQEDRQSRLAERRNRREQQSATPRRLRDWSATLAFIGRDIPTNRWDEWNAFVLRQHRGINVAERGGTVGNKHAQSAFSVESTSSRALRGWVLRELGWDEHPPAERFRLVLKEIDGSGGLYESFEAFSGYLQKDRNLYPDWTIEHTANVTDEMLQIGASLFCGCAFSVRLFCGPF